MLIIRILRLFLRKNNVSVTFRLQKTDPYLSSPADTTKEATQAAPQPCHNLCHLPVRSESGMKSHNKHYTTLESVTRCLTLSVTLTPRSYHHTDGTFPDLSHHILGTLHQYRTLVCRYTLRITSAPNPPGQAPTNLESSTSVSLHNTTLTVVKSPRCYILTNRASPATS